MNVECKLDAAVSPQAYIGSVGQKSEPCKSESICASDTDSEHSAVADVSTEAVSRNPQLEMALKLAELGYAVIPVTPNAKKPPLVNRGLLDATTDVPTIERWFASWPDANLAIRTDGLLVVDVDPVDGQPNPWLTPERAIELSVAPFQITPRGGRHYFFSDPEGRFRNSQGRIALNVDSRGAGGYALVAPSSIDGKEYHFPDQQLDVEPSKLPCPPTWLADALKAPAESRLTGRTELATGNGATIPQSRRNGTLASMGGAMRHYGFEQRAIEAALRVTNQDFCSPPLAEGEVTTIAKSVSRYKPEEAKKMAEKQAEIYEPVIVRLADVNPEPVQWFWPGRIALGKLTLVAGDPGLGKSFLTLDLAARVSCGSPWPDNTNSKAPLGSVVLLGAEDALGDTIRPRLDAMGADVSKIIAIEAVQGADRQHPVDLQRDLPAVESAIKQLGDCRLVVIDPISAYLGKVDSHNNAEIRALLHPLSELADRYKVAILAVTHLNKGAGSAIYRATGSLAFVAASRAAWLVAKDKTLPERRLFVPVKNNLANDTQGMAFAIVDGRVQWESEPVVVDPNDLLGSEPGKDAANRSKQNDAATWLVGQLKNGPMDAADIIERADDDGISESRVKRAKRSLGVIGSKTGFDAGWRWRLPEVGAQGVVEACTVEVIPSSSSQPMSGEPITTPEFATAG